MGTAEVTCLLFCHILLVTGPPWYKRGEHGRQGSLEPSWKLATTTSNTWSDEKEIRKKNKFSFSPLYSIFLFTLYEFCWKRLSLPVSWLIGTTLGCIIIKLIVSVYSAYRYSGKWDEGERMLKRTFCVWLFGIAGGENLSFWLPGAKWRLLWFQ